MLDQDAQFLSDVIHLQDHIARKLFVFIALAGLTRWFVQVLAEQLALAKQLVEAGHGFWVDYEVFGGKRLDGQ